MANRTLCIVAGDPSGDRHGALLIAELKARHPDWRFWGVGGDLMQQAGMDLWQHARDWAVMGFAEVLKSLPRFHKHMTALTDKLTAERPDGVILIDYPGFNLKLAPKAHKLGIPVMYYIVPQIWAWGKGRIKIFRKSVDRTIVVFPFEKEFFESRDVTVDWVGHPFVDTVKPSADRAKLRQRVGVGGDHEKLVALMPGVRTQDYDSHLPVFTEALKRIAEAVPGVRAAIGVSRAVTEVARPLDRDPVPVLLTPDVYDLLAAADVVITKTGTTTVECAIIGTPMVTAFKTGGLNYAIARSLVDVPFIAMPNLIANRRIVPELVQSAVTPAALADEAIALLTKPAVAEQQRRDLASVREALGPPGAVSRAAGVVGDWLKA